MFDKNKLREEIANTWGEYGSHMEVFDELLKSSATEESLRLAFKAGVKWGVFIAVGEDFDEPFDENEYIESLNPKVEHEETIPITYGMIKATCGWGKFCDVTGYNHYAIKEFGHPDDSTTYEIKKSEYDKLF